MKRGILLPLVLCTGLFSGVYAPAAEEIVIGGMAALQQGFGQSMQAGSQLAVEEINAAGGILGRPIRIVWTDTELSPSTGRTLAQRLIFNDRVQFILGCHSSTVVLATAPMMSQNRILNIAMGSAQTVTEQNNPWIVRVRENDLLMADVLANYMVDELGLTKIACISMSEQYGIGGKDNLNAALKKKNLELIAVEAHNIGDKDFTSQLLSVRRSGAEAVAIVSGVPDLGIMVKQARQLIPNVQIFMSSVGATKAFMDVAEEAAVGSYAVCTYTADNPDQKVQNFIAAFQKKHHSPPFDFFSGLSYDAIYMLKQAIDKIGDLSQREKIRDAFKEISDFKGATGLTYNGKPNGEMVNELLFIQYSMEAGNLKHNVIATVTGD
ncbi:MAG: ABC transporter substrate-binding protein [Planctomycetes bacterium]|nr:ABC transporter substrate-binding protein [Planctomycetota bacterium]